MPKTPPRYNLSRDDLREIEHSNGLDGDFERSFNEWERDESPFPENPEVDPFLYGEDD